MIIIVSILYERVCVAEALCWNIYDALGNKIKEQVSLHQGVVGGLAHGAPSLTAQELQNLKQYP